MDVLKNQYENRLPSQPKISRTTYAALWAFAQIEITAGSTLYNNGDGSTTFGIVDMLGWLPVGWDKMGRSIEAVKAVPWTALQELKGDAELLKKIDAAETMLRSLRKALS
ncbi:hypothetical protein [Bradyrhizobium sp.]|uniref:hypothetical protein n=1 Tax=Bradyrhizobium sp. TaxID=376 RepID=UPI00261EFB6A|nr:hypothetical protein [Bradyrhizobium sp.]